AASPSGRQHPEELRVLQHQLRRAVLVYVDALNVRRPVALCRPARSAGDHDRAARMAGERRREPRQTGPVIRTEIGLVPRGLVAAVEEVLPTEIEQSGVGSCLLGLTEGPLRALHVGAVLGAVGVFVPAAVVFARGPGPRQLEEGA